MSSAPLWISLAWALAHDAPGAEQHSVTADGVVDACDPLPHLRAAAQLRVSWAKDPLTTRAADGTIKRAPSHGLSLDAAAGLGLFDSVEVGFVATGDSVAVPGEGLVGLLAQSPGATLYGKWLVVDDGLVSVVARAVVTHRLSVAPAVVVAVDAGFVDAAVDVSAYVDVDGAYALPFAARVGVPVADVFVVGAEVFGAVSAADAGAAPAVEGLVTLRFGTDVAAVLGVGGGLVAGMGTPEMRVLVGLHGLFSDVDFDDDFGDDGDDVEDLDDNGADAVEDDATVTAAPVAAPARILEDGAALGDVALFVPGTAALAPGASARLRPIAAHLRSTPDIVRVVVAGHADGAGRDPASLALAQQRANAVRALFVDDGVDAARVVAHVAPASLRGVDRAGVSIVWSHADGGLR